MWMSELITNVLSAYFLTWTFLTVLLVHICQEEKTAGEIAGVNGLFYSKYIKHHSTFITQTLKQNVSNKMSDFTIFRDQTTQFY